MFVTKKRFDREMWILAEHVDALKRQVARLEATAEAQRNTITRQTTCFSTLLRHLNLRFEYEAERPAQYVLKEGK